MKKILFALLLGAPCVLHAQNVTVKLSNKFSLRDRGLTQKDGATFMWGNFFYCTETDYKGMQFAYTAKLEKVKYAVNIYKYDAEMKELQKASLPGGFSLGPFPPSSILFNGKIVLVYYNVLEKGAIQLMYSVVDPETLGMSAGKELYVISEKNVGLFKLGQVFTNNKLHLRVSPDSSKLLVVQAGNTNEMVACIINKDMEAGKAVISKVKPNMEDFTVQDAVMDNAGNKYFTYSFTEDKTIKNGVLIQNNNGKDAFLSFKSTQDGQDPGTLFVKLSRDNTKVYVFGASVGEFLEEGVMLATVDAASLKLGKQQLFPYPQDLRERLYKNDFADKKHGNYSVKKAFYVYHEMADGTVVLTGYPINVVTGTHMGRNNLPAGTYSFYYAGPILNIFVKDGKGRFGVVYRNQEMGHGSAPLIVPYGDKLLCIYYDSEKGLASDKPEHTDKRRDAGELVLAMAVLGNDGSLISRKKLLDRVGSSVFMTNHQQSLTGNTYLVPVGHDRVNLTRYYTEVEQWATLEVN